MRRKEGEGKKSRGEAGLLSNNHQFYSGPVEIRWKPGGWSGPEW
jgi:hypothetical protein